MRSWVERFNYYSELAETCRVMGAEAEVKGKPALAQSHREDAESYQRQAEAIRRTGLKLQSNAKRKREMFVKPKPGGKDVSEEAA